MHRVAAVALFLSVSFSAAFAITPDDAARQRAQSHNSKANKKWLKSQRKAYKKAIAKTKHDKKHG